jgi:anaerobic selenocysteine-containing dehydrogenase
MTNGWVDIKNTDMMLIMGGNPPRTTRAASSGH